MANTSISISRPKTALPTCTPNLMPFHIDYSGPAPISTYFRVKVPLEEGNSEGTESEAKSHNDSWRSQLSAAFRGRVVRGLEVKLPEGYSGVVLRSDASTSNANSKPVQATRGIKRKATNGTKTRRTTRRASKKTDPIDVDGDAEWAELQDEESLIDSEEMINRAAAAQLLKPSATFSSMVVWNPDVPVDENRDEYIRALNEWISVAREVHRIEDDSD